MIVVLCVWLHLDLLSIFTEVGVRIGEAVAEVDLVVILFEGVSKCERVIFFVGETVPIDLVAEVILVVAYVGAYAVPA